MLFISRPKASMCSRVLQKAETSVVWEEFWPDDPASSQCHGRLIFGTVLSTCFNRVKHNPYPRTSPKSFGISYMHPHVMTHSNQNRNMCKFSGCLAWSLCNNKLPADDLKNFTSSTTPSSLANIFCGRNAEARSICIVVANLVRNVSYVVCTTEPQVILVDCMKFR